MKRKSDTTNPEPAETDRELDQALRPLSFADFHGQQKIVDNLRVFITAARKRREPLDHVLLTGPPGLGKTTLAHIIADEMGAGLKSTSGPVLDKPGDLAGLLTNLTEGEVLFIDEIHRLNPVVEEYLYSAMEDYRLDIMIDAGPNARSIQLSLPRFTLIGATTRAGLLTAPLRARFGVSNRLDYYTGETLFVIIQRSARLLNVKIDREGTEEIAHRSRGTPRIANRLLRRCRDFAQADPALAHHQGMITREVADYALRAMEVDEHGLDEMDKRILLCILEKYEGGPVGLNTLAVAVGEEPGTIEEVYEPYLIQEGFVKRTARGREATSLAYTHFGLKRRGGSPATLFFLKAETMDNDLQSIQEVRDALRAAHEAQQQFRSFTQEQVDRVCAAMAAAGAADAARLGRLATEETGFGKPEDKEKKNQFATQRVWESIAALKTVGVIREDTERKVVHIAEPMGIVAALIPSTNPTSTVMFKALISVKARNAIVASPHPHALRCTREAMHVVRDAAEQAGAPRALMACLGVPTQEGTAELMRHKLTSIILATGSNAMVRAAYSSGKPAYGVGAGNVPAFIERTADIEKAVADILSGKEFDYGVLCSTESALICDAPVKAQVVDACLRRNAVFVTGEDLEKLSRLMFDSRGALNPAMVGRSPLYIARAAGITVPEQVTVLIAELEGVGKQYPLSREKLSPVLSMYTANGWRDACHRSIELLEFGGIGHTVSIHSRDNDIIMRFAMEKPAFRILVNTQSALGAVGYTNGLDPSMTLGPGTWGGSIISENVTARHLMNIKKLAYETRPLNPPGHTPGPSAAPLHTPTGGTSADTDPTVYGTALTADDVDRLARQFARERGTK